MAEEEKMQADNIDENSNHEKNVYVNLLDQCHVNGLSLGEELLKRLI